MDKFVVTIARGYGSGGRRLGKMLAQELKVNFYDKEILRMASDNSGINEKTFENADEKLKGTLLFKVAKNVYKSDDLYKSDRYLTDDQLFNYQAEVLKELAKKESFVVIGRCADYILRDNPNIIRIFVHAPIDKCTEVVENMTTMTRAEIQQFIYKTDKDRAEYYYHHTKRAWLDARNYDLCFDTSKIKLEKCIKIIKNYIELKKD